MRTSSLALLFVILNGIAFIIILILEIRNKKHSNKP